jgi:dTDP-4-dehydrorhamnose reductase
MACKCPDAASRILTIVYGLLSWAVDRAGGACRPRSSALANAKAASAFDIGLPAWQDSPASCMAQSILTPAGKKEIVA